MAELVRTKSPSTDRDVKEFAQGAGARPTNRRGSQQGLDQQKIGRRHPGLLLGARHS